MTTAVVVVCGLFLIFGILYRVLFCSLVLFCALRMLTGVRMGLDRAPKERMLAKQRHRSVRSVTTPRAKAPSDACPKSISSMTRDPLLPTHTHTRTQLIIGGVATSRWSCDGAPWVPPYWTRNRLDRKKSVKSLSSGLFSEGETALPARNISPIHATLAHRNTYTHAVTRTCRFSAVKRPTRSACTESSNRDGKLFYETKTGTKTKIFVLPRFRFLSLFSCHWNFLSFGYSLSRSLSCPSHLPATHTHTLISISNWS